MGEALDLLDGLGIDTAEIRANDRKLVFPEIGVITMRPSDVPSYVEHGAADVGITGRDVLPSSRTATSTNCSTWASAAAG